MIDLNHKLEELDLLDRDIEKYLHETIRPSQDEEFFEYLNHLFNIYIKGINLKKEIILDIGQISSIDNISEKARSVFYKIKNSIKNSNEAVFNFEKRVNEVYSLFNKVSGDKYSIEDSIQYIMSDDNQVINYFHSNYDIFSIVKRMLEVSVLCSNDIIPNNYKEYFGQIKESYVFSNNIAVFVLCRSLLEISLRDALNESSCSRKSLDQLIDEAHHRNIIFQNERNIINKIRSNGNNAAHGKLLIFKSDSIARYCIENTALIIEKIISRVS